MSCDMVYVLLATSFLRCPILPPLSNSPLQLSEQPNGIPPPYLTSFNHLSYPQLDSISPRVTAVATPLRRTPSCPLAHPLPLTPAPHPTPTPLTLAIRTTGTDTLVDI